MTAFRRFPGSGIAFVRSVTAVMALLLANAAFAAPAKKAPSVKKLKLATLAPRNSAFHNILRTMEEKWRQAPGGVGVTIHTDGESGTEGAVVSKMRLPRARIQMALLSVSGLSEIDRSAASLASVPLMFRSLDELDYVSSCLQPKLNQRLAEHGFVVLFWTDAGWVRFFSKKPLIRYRDLQKTKLFVTAGDNDQVNLMKSAGYHPVPLETSDMLSSLTTGLIDTVPTIPYIAQVGLLSGKAPNMTQVNWGPLVGALVIKQDVWMALPVETRRAMQKAASEAGDAMKIASRQQSDQAVGVMQRNGLKVQTLTPEIEEEWRTEVAKFYPKIRGKLVPADVFDDVLAHLEKYRAGKGACK